MLLNNLLVMLATVFTVASCNSAETANSKETTKETIEVADAKASDSSEQTTSNYLNGITKKNSGTKKGKMELRGKIAGRAPANTIYLYETEGRNYSKIDSAVIKDGAFDFGKREYERGFYMFSIQNENNMCSFIMNPDEEVVELNFTTMRLENGLQSVQSKENTGWVEYYKKEAQINSTIQNFKKSRASSSVKGKFDKLIADKEAERVAFQHSIIKKYPDTFLAKVVTWNQNPYKNDMGRYWSDIDFTDESLVHTTVMPTRIQDFMIIHSGATESGFINCVDLTKANAEVNPKVLEYVLILCLMDSTQAIRK